MEDTTCVTVGVEDGAVLAEAVVGEGVPFEVGGQIVVQEADIE